MAKISTYPIDSNVTVNDMVIGTDAEDMNMTKNYPVKDLATTINSLNQATLRLYAEETANQGLSVLDTPYQITFGPAQTGGIVDVSATGTITFNQEGAFYVKFFGNFDMKATVTPGNGNIYFRSLINGNQNDNVALIELDTFNLATPFEKCFFVQSSIGSTVTFEMFLSSIGSQSGGLYAVTVPILWSNVPSSSVEIWQIN
jgi:hypothetical protein